MKRSYSGYLYIVLCAVIFSAMEVMLKTVHGVFAPMQITCLRFLIGGLLLIPFALRSMKKKGAAFTRADAGFFALTGFLCVAFSMVLYQMAVTHTKASVVAVIFSCNPIFVTVLASLLLHERIRRNHIIALALELLAVLIIIDPLHASLDPTGALLAIASALVFSFYSVVGKKRTPRFGGIAVTCFSFLFGSVELLAVLLPLRSWGIERGPFFRLEWSPLIGSRALRGKSLAPHGAKCGLHLLEKTAILSMAPHGHIISRRMFPFGNIALR